MSPEIFTAFATPLTKPLCLVDSHGQILAFNPAVLKFLDVNSESITNKNLFDLVTNNEKQVENILRIWSRCREMTPGPLMMRVGNKRVFPCNCHGALIQPRNETTRALLLIHFEHKTEFSKSFTALNEKIALLKKEIKEHKETTNNLAQRNAEFQAMFRAIPDTVLFVDIKRQILLSNPAAYEMFGYNNAELIGNTTEMLYADKRDFHIQGNNRYNLRKSKNNEAYEVKYKRKDGSTFWAETVGTQVKNNTDQAIGYIGLIRDITKRHQINNELEQHRNHLEAMVEERTTELAATNKELESFSYSVSHDLMAPLRSIDGFNQLLIEEYAEQIDDKGKDYLQRVRNNTQKMRMLINDMLALARVTQISLNRETIDLSALAQETINKLRELEPQRHVTTNIESNLQVWADKQLLGIALDNLFGNAWKYTGREPMAEISFGSEIKDGNIVYFIRDNGAGFDMECASKIFDAFQRLHKSKEFEGTGIGLATVDRIFRRHNGNIWVNAKVGQGATFYFTLSVNQLNNNDITNSQNLEEKSQSSVTH